MGVGVGIGRMVDGFCCDFGKGWEGHLMGVRGDEGGRLDESRLVVVWLVVIW